MPKYDPRYIYPRGYDYGNTALGLADLLGQGFDRLHRWNQDAQGQDNNQRDYLMRLQQMLGQQEGQGLDRQMKQQSIDLQGKQIEDLMANRKATAEQAAAQRGALGKFFGGLGQDVPTQEPAPQPAQQGLAVSPQAEDRTLSQFVYGKRKATPQDAVAGMGAEAANLPTSFTDALLKFYQERAPKPPEYGSSPLGIYRKDTGQVTERVPEKAAPAEKPTDTTVLLDAARDRLSKQGVTEPTPGQLGTMAETIRQERAKAGASNTTVNLSASERDKNAEQENVSALGAHIRNLVAESPGLIGGPLGAKGRLNTLKMKFNSAPEKFGAILKGTQTLKAVLVHELTGANIGPSDQKVYMDQMPDAETNSDQEFAANLDTTLANIDRLRGIRARIQGTPKGQPTINTDSARGGAMPPLDMNAIDRELAKRGIK